MPANDTLPHILVLDADASAAQVTRAGVERALPQASVVVVSTPEEAWASAEQRPPDALIIDPAPSQLASAWLIQSIKVAYPGIHIIVLASAPAPALRRNGQRAHIDVYLDKPAPLPVLVQAVRSVLHDNRSGQS